MAASRHLRRPPVVPRPVLASPTVTASPRPLPALPDRPPFVLRGRILTPTDAGGTTFHPDGIVEVDARGRIARVGPADLRPDSAGASGPMGGHVPVVDLRPLVLLPGLVDLHAHVFYGTEPDSAYSNGTNALPPDGFTFRSCVTTVVDTGGSGWRDFPLFQRQVIERSETRVLAMLNIVGSGMQGGPIEQDLSDMDPKLTALRARENRDVVVGIKVAHYQGPEWDPVDLAHVQGD